MPRCIYCLESKHDEFFRKAEHVLPQSFGMFESSFTLRGIVCDACNQYFGDQVEIVLARDTFEGHSRFAHGVKNPEEFRPFGRSSRIVIRVKEGPFEGAYAYRDYSGESGQVVLQPLPQVGFLIAQSGKYEYFLLDDIPTERQLQQRGFDSRHLQGIYGIAVDEGPLRDKLAEKGIQFRYEGAAVPPRQSQALLCEVEGTIDQKIFRAIGKIAFNYLAYWQGPEFLLEEPFNVARRYIRYGDNPAYRMVDIREEAILADEPFVGRRRLGHLITTSWAQDRVSIVAQVSLFNWVTYCVSLVRDYPGEPRDIRRGQFFDVSTRKILELGAR